MKRFILTLALIAAIAAPVFTAAPAKTTPGKVTAIEGTKVTIAIDGDKPDWVKKNAFVKFVGASTGKVVEVSAPETKPATMVLTYKKASQMKVGDAVAFEKGLSVAGC